MNSFIKTSLLILVLISAGCSTSNKVSKKSTPPDTATVEKPAELTESANDWHLKSPSDGVYYGTEVEKAYATLLAKKKAKKKVIVAVIDSGIDIEHEDLSSKIWTNEDEIPGNNIDDDGNGYVDDVHGWNFIGGPNGENVNKDTYELTRVYVSLLKKYEDADTTEFNEEQKEEYLYFQTIEDSYMIDLYKNQQVLSRVTNLRQAITGALEALNVSSLDSVDVADLEAAPDDDEFTKQAKELLGNMKKFGVNIEELQDAYDHYYDLLEYGLNPEFDPRPIVGDDYADFTNRYYGNNDVIGVHNDHGTHVAGIIAAARNNGKGMDGIAESVVIMPIRAVPDGDERDKDVANAIRYAAENGADIINMSFGKSYSPEKFYVDDAVKFADSVGVLIIHAAGNDGANVDSVDNFPSKNYIYGGSAKDYLTIGASSWKSDSSLSASFSNYGKKAVDLFAPGVSIYSTTPGNTYAKFSGTSMASPVVSGVAALIMSYYPDLTASQVKDILLKSTTKPAIEAVYQPGSENVVSFSSLSVSGGIVDAYKALQMAEKLSK